ncbi:MAG: sugar phosphate isomerase/epimerase [Armatimonadota bacterium]|jgi:sugar phosphate isomerase/epimerase|nr:sugar phosphate isomerase/epimerase [Armatimonadota bacterium]
MQLGFVSAILPDQSLEEVVAFAAQAGYQCVELMCWPRGKAERRYAGVTHLDVVDFTPADAARVRQLFANAGLSISGLGYYPNPLSPDPNEAAACIEHLKRVIAAAALLQVDVVNTFVGRDWKRPADENWHRFREVWPPLIAFAESHGVRVAIENCPMLFTADEWPAGKNLAHSPAIWRRMFEEIPSPSFGLNYDPSHLVWQQMDYLKPIPEFAPRIFHVHAKDARVDRSRLDDVGILALPPAYHTPKLPGLGDVDWGRFLSVLGDAGYTGAVCVEVEDRAYERSLATRHAALRQSHRYLSQFLP